MLVSAHHRSEDNEYVEMMREDRKEKEVKQKRKEEREQKKAGKEKEQEKSGDNKGRRIRDMRKEKGKSASGRVQVGLVNIKQGESPNLEQYSFESPNLEQYSFDSGTSTLL